MVHQVCFLCFTTDISNLNFRLQVVCNFHVEMSEFNLKISLQIYKVKTIIVLDSIINSGLILLEIVFFPPKMQTCQSLTSDMFLIVMVS